MGGFKNRLRFVGRAAGVAKEYGLWNLVPVVASELFYEARLRSNTARVYNHDELGLSGELREHGRIYAPVPYYFLRKALSWVAIEEGKSVFVDFGCGLGRALLFASRLPFRKVIGVEASPRLARAAEENLGALWDRVSSGSTEWAVVPGDARHFEIPQAASVFFFNDPFDEHIMLPVIENLLTSQRRSPRELWAIYVNPSCPSVFTDHGFQERYRSVNLANKGYIVYHLERSPERA